MYNGYNFQFYLENSQKFTSLAEARRVLSESQVWDETLCGAVVTPLEQAVSDIQNNILEELIILSQDSGNIELNHILADQLVSLFLPSDMQKAYRAIPKWFA